MALPGRRPIATIYSPKEYAEWQKVALAALKDVPAFAIDGLCTVRVGCHVTRPKTTKLSAPKPDVDNYAKGVLDVITKDGRFWSDDCQVWDLSVCKAWTSGPSHILVEIERDL